MSLKECYSTRLYSTRKRLPSVYDESVLNKQSKPRLKSNFTSRVLFTLSLYISLRNGSKKKLHSDERPFLTINHQFKPDEVTIDSSNLQRTFPRPLTTSPRLKKSLHFHRINRRFPLFPADYGIRRWKDDDPQPAFQRKYEFGSGDVSKLLSGAQRSPNYTNQSKLS